MNWRSISEATKIEGYKIIGMTSEYEVYTLVYFPKSYIGINKHIELSDGWMIEQHPSERGITFEPIKFIDFQEWIKEYT